MKAPGVLRKLARLARGLGRAVAIEPDALREAASRELPLVLALGEIDERLPGEQRRTTLETLAESVAEIRKDRLIVTHCT